MFLPENHFIYASQVTLRSQNHLMINRLSLGAYLIDILVKCSACAQVDLFRLSLLLSSVYSMVLLDWMLLFPIFFL